MANLQTRGAGRAWAGSVRREVQIGCTVAKAAQEHPGEVRNCTNR